MCPIGCMAVQWTHSLRAGSFQNSGRERKGKKESDDSKSSDFRSISFNMVLSGYDKRSLLIFGRLLYCQDPMLLNKRTTDGSGRTAAHDLPRMSGGLVGCDSIIKVKRRVWLVGD